MYLMTDVLTKKQRSYNMSQIKSRNTSPELKLRKKLRGLEFTYQPKIYGKPDFANRKKRILIFVDGCFWHHCKKCFVKPKTNKGFWNKKIRNNCIRDKKVNKYLKKEGWIVLRFWEHEIKNIENCYNIIYAGIR